MNSYRTFSSHSLSSTTDTSPVFSHKRWDRGELALAEKIVAFMKACQLDAMDRCIIDEIFSWRIGLSYADETGYGIKLRPCPLYTTTDASMKRLDEVTNEFIEAFYVPQNRDCAVMQLVKDKTRIVYVRTCVVHIGD